MSTEPPAVGLCASCRHGEPLATARSVFLRCRLSDVDPRFARYPRLPVLACEGYEGGDEGGDDSVLGGRLR